MKPNIAINFNKVSKKFRKGRRVYLKQALLDVFKPQKQEDFWALKDISFEINKGETVGIIGNNGSGKSTILKLIAGVLSQTKGSIFVNGRISPLIELGAGFHPELTGRENIYLSGTILGLTSKEIDKKFNSIVEFSELEEFIDTPIKHYSSGMYMRLGFSIAINIEPDILLIDEIFAVGDVSFQQKCFKKMREFQELGITIVLISHTFEIVGSFCKRVILIEDGKITRIGNTKKIISEYLSKEIG